MQASCLSEDVPALSNGFPEKMVILDCETTGGKSTHHRIIEIGLLIIENGHVIEKWQTFIDPDTSLPQAIQKLTGIHPGMLYGAPTFSDIADELLYKLKDRTLVAHNARFDHGFLKNEFLRLGIRYNAKPLCSVKFSRIMFPQFKHHGLDQIIKRFKFSIENRHRALDDAKMIYKLFQKASELFAPEDISSTCHNILKRPALPALLNATEIDKLPASAGVYYFYDQTGALLYIGKSVHVLNRVMSHFTQDYKNPKDLQMSSKIAHIDFDRTPTDFGAQILESQQIKLLQPFYNRQLRKVKKLYRCRISLDDQGYQRAYIEAIDVDGNEESAQFGLFRSSRQATQRLQRLADQYFLCHKLLGLESDTSSNRNKPCFRSQLKKCFGACHGAESPETYNDRMSGAFKEYQFKMWPWNSAIMIEEGSGKGSAGVAYHIVDHWRYVARLSVPEDVYDYDYQPVEGNAWSAKPPNSDNMLRSTQMGSTHDHFDLDAYFILIRFLLDPEKLRLNSIRIWPLCASVETAPP